MVVTRKNPSVRTMLAVDFPRQGERVSSAQYTLRVSAPDDIKSMDVSIDQGDWQPCRKSVGYWWRDWSGYDSGEHEIVARIETSDGKFVSCEPHEFFVELPKEAKAV